MVGPFPAVTLSLTLALGSETNRASFPFKGQNHRGQEKCLLRKQLGPWARTKTGKPQEPAGGEGGPERGKTRTDLRIRVQLEQAQMWRSGCAHGGRGTG